MIHEDLTIVGNLVWLGVLLHNYMRTCDDEEGVPLTNSCAPPANVDSNGAQYAYKQKVAGPENPCYNFQNLEPTTSDNEPLQDQNICRAFANYFCSAVEEVPWQYIQGSRGSRRVTL